MRLSFGSRQLERLCINEREMRRQRADIAPKLRLRIKALQAAACLEDLPRLDPLGRWHELTAARAGQWAGWLSRNWRLIVERIDAGGTDVCVLIVDVEDYH